MVCDRCIASVKQIFEAYGYRTMKVTLGEVVLNVDIKKSDLPIIEQKLKLVGFELLDNTTPILVNKIKGALISLFNLEEINEDFKLSTYLTEKFPYDYSHLSRVFSHSEKDTIEHFLI